MLVSILTMMVAQGPAPVVHPANFNPRAIELFERDWVLMQWGRRQFDANANGVLSREEAQAAAAAFKSLADSDKDDRVTTAEYDRARQAILTRD